MCFVSVSSGRLRQRSSCGLTCSTSTPNSVLASCIERNAAAKRCCVGESETIASRNALADGCVASASGTLSSSLVDPSAACVGTNSLADAICPTSTIIDENWHARAP